MKKNVFQTLLIILGLCCFHAGYAQDKVEIVEPFFKPEHLIVGGTVNAAFGNQTTQLGISPYIGYSFNKFVDLAISPGINYISERDYMVIGDKLRQTTYGPGAFVRIFPVKFLYAIGQYEFNLMKNKYIPAIGSTLQSEVYKTDAHSFLVGAGFASGRNFDYQKSYYYFSVMWDIGEAPHSPYKDNLGRSVPIFRAGYNIALFQGNQR